MHVIPISLLLYVFNALGWKGTDILLNPGGVISILAFVIGTLSYTDTSAMASVKFVCVSIMFMSNLFTRSIMWILLSYVLTDLPMAYH